MYRIIVCSSCRVSQVQHSSPSATLQVFTWFHNVWKTVNYAPAVLTPLTRFYAFPGIVCAFSWIHTYSSLSSSSAVFSLPLLGWVQGNYSYLFVFNQDRFSHLFNKVKYKRERKQFSRYCYCRKKILKIFKCFSWYLHA